MIKENGRLSKSEGANDISNLRGRHFVCAECGSHTIFVNVEFGEKVLCGQCGNEMDERLSIDE